MGTAHLRILRYIKAVWCMKYSEGYCQKQCNICVLAYWYNFERFQASSVV